MLKVPVDPVVSAGFYRDSWTIICSVCAVVEIPTCRDVFENCITMCNIT